MSRGFYVKGLIFGILQCVATDTKMLRVSAKFAYQNTGPICHILLLSTYIFATYLQGANLCKSIFSIQEKFKCLYLKSPCSAFIQVAKSCSFFLIIADFFGSLKFALILFCISDRVFSFL